MRELQVKPRVTELEVEQPPEPQLLLSAPTVLMDQDADGGAVVLVSQPTVQVAPGAGHGEQALVPMAEDSEAPQQEAAASQGAAQSEVVAVALVEETRRSTVLVSASGNHLAQHTEVEVRQQASFSSQDTQVSLERSAQA